MALLWIDSFSHYTNGVSKGWTGGTGGVFNGSYGRFAGGFQATPWAGAPQAASRLVAVGATGVVGFAFKSDAPINGDTLLFVLEGTTTQHLKVMLDVALRPCVYSGSTLLATSTFTYLPNIWTYFELAFTIGSSGSFELRANGNAIASGSGVNTKNGGTGLIDTVGLGGTGNGSAHPWWCDFYCKSGTGFLGDCRVECLLPTGAGAETQWTPSAGANWQNVDETPDDGDTTYNKSNTVGQVDTYAMGDLVSTTGIIYGVQKMNYVCKDNAGSRSVAPVLRIGGTDHVGASTSIGDSYTYTREIEEVSPATLAAFTISEVNAMEAGIVVTA